MKLREIFESDVTRDIPPVIYFHEQSPEELQKEVSEYIITGGYPEGDPRHQRVPRGIHEHFVKLLTKIRKELDKPRGPDLPNSWISGFYGSGKSSFAKLLGLGLEDVELPGELSLAERLLRRDNSPNASDFREAWEALQQKIDPISVVFDIGATARSNEPVHAAAIRQIQEKLGYSTTDALVADYELKLEREGEWDVFTEAVAQELNARWSEVKDNEFVDDDFSRVLHRMYPERYPETTDWVNSRVGMNTESRSVKEAAEAIEDMLEFRAPDKTLFLVIDEVSQYIHGNHERMLKLQSFASALGKQLEGRVWMLVTGQEKLEEESEATVVGRLKDRFPPKFRVHLDATNIRDVVHERLLRKDEAHKDTLRGLFEQYRHNLDLYAYECSNISKEDFLEVYPMLPNHIDLLMEITTAMRTRSSRTQGDDHAIRGLMQMLGELFRERNLADDELGRLVALDDIYEVQSSALSNDIQRTMARILEHTSEDRLAARAAKAVALLQLIQDDEPTSAELVAKCLYDRLDRGDRTDEVEEALERLRDENFLSYSEKSGYKLQSSAGQEWMRERRDIGISYDKASDLVREQLRFLIDNTPRPAHEGVKFGWKAMYSDGRNADDEAIKNPNNRAVATVDFRLARHEERNTTDWIKKSDSTHEDRLIWVVGGSDALIQTAREWGRSRRMVQRYEMRRESLEHEELSLLGDEQARESDLEVDLRDAIKEAWMKGSLYFRGQSTEPRDLGGSFSTVLHNAAEARLPTLYKYYESTKVTENELKRLLDREFAGISEKFLERNLGILSMDAGTLVPTCEGEIPRRILQYIESSGGAGGASLLEEFEGQPFGYHRSLIKACLVGLLLANKIEIQPDGGQKITSYRDLGTKDVFSRDRDLRSASFMPAGTGPISARDRVQICNFFEKYFERTVPRQNDAIADAVFECFPGVNRQRESVIDELNKLPDAIDIPETVQELGSAVGACLSSRQVQPTVECVKQHLNALRDGLPVLRMLDSELNDDAREVLRDAERALQNQYSQLQAIDAGDEELRQAAERIEEQLGAEYPWRDSQGIRANVEILEERYRDIRRGLLEEQGQTAENARETIKLREGYEELDADESNKVLRPIARASIDAEPDALYPELSKIRSAIQLRIPEALERAHDRLDEILEKETPVRKVRMGLRNRTIRSEEELDSLFEELKERAKEHLGDDMHVRFV